jgi:hypothetical protein
MNAAFVRNSIMTAKIQAFAVALLAGLLLQGSAQASEFEGSWISRGNGIVTYSQYGTRIDGSFAGPGTWETLNGGASSTGTVDGHTAKMTFNTGKGETGSHVATLSGDGNSIHVKWELFRGNTRIAAGVWSAVRKSPQ